MTQAAATMVKIQVAPEPKEKAAPELNTSVRPKARPRTGW